MGTGDLRKEVGRGGGGREREEGRGEKGGGRRERPGETWGGREQEKGGRGIGSGDNTTITHCKSGNLHCQIFPGCHQQTKFKLLNKLRNPPKLS